MPKPPTTSLERFDGRGSLVGKLTLRARAECVVVGFIVSNPALGVVHLQVGFEPVPEPTDLWLIYAAITRTADPAGRVNGYDLYRNRIEAQDYLTWRTDVSSGLVAPWVVYASSRALPLYNRMLDTSEPARRLVQSFLESRPAPEPVPS